MKILVAPMDWGLGHASRCVPLIQALQKNGAEVVLAGEGRSGHYLQQVFPDLKYYPLPPYNIRYTDSTWLIPYLCMQIPGLMLTFRKEKQEVDSIIKKENINAVISDNRYGVYSEKIPSVFITHQIAPIAPFRSVGYRIHLAFMGKFTHVWVPDFESPPFLSGGLSHDYPLPPHARFIGSLSRFTSYAAPVKPESQTPCSFDIVAVLSGVEPQRTILEKLLIEKFKAFPDKKTCIIQGKSEISESRTESNVYIRSFADNEMLYSILKNSKVVISRGGYSSLMDFAALGIEKVILIPTPGQTEQEYLAKYFQKNNVAVCTSQAEMNLAKALVEVENCTGFPQRENGALTQFLSRWLSEISTGKSR